MKTSISVIFSFFAFLIVGCDYKKDSCDGFVIPVYAKSHYENGYGSYLDYLGYYFKDSTRLLHSLGEISTISLQDTIVGTQTFKTHTTGSCYDTYVTSTLKASLSSSDSLFVPISIILNNGVTINYGNLRASKNTNYKATSETIQGFTYSQTEKYTGYNNKDTVNIIFDKQFGIVKIINSTTDFYERLP